MLVAGVTILFDTTTVDPVDRRESWSQAHERIFFPIGVQPSGDLAHSRIEGHALGPLRAFRVTSDPSVVRRTSQGIKVFDPEQFVVGTPLSGRSVIEQAGRDSMFGTGDLSTWESSHAFAATHVERFELLLMVMPRALLGARRDAAYRQTAGRMPRDSPLGTIAAPFFRHVWDALDAGESVQHEDLADGVLALVRAMHAPEPVPALSGAALVTKIKGYIDEHLADPGLGPAAIAHAHYISVRYLHKLFAAEGVSVSEWVRHRRLEACRRDLRDPALAHETISQIGRRWALANPTHFSRLFRETYGLTPTELRELT
jgi:AraC-like DNA-binding protein